MPTIKVPVYLLIAAIFVPMLATAYAAFSNSKAKSIEIENLKNEKITLENDLDSVYKERNRYIDILTGEAKLSSDLQHSVSKIKGELDEAKRRINVASGSGSVVCLRQPTSKAESPAVPASTERDNGASEDRFLAAERIDLAAAIERQYAIAAEADAVANRLVSCQSVIKNRFPETVVGMENE